MRPLPNEHNPLSDEARSRMRYVDLIVRPEARDNVRVKAKVLQSLRATLDAHEFIEVDTPVLQHTNGGAAARPFTTHTNAFDEDMLLRIAIELDLKRALVGGVDRVYEIGKTFRNEGVDNTHNPEFMMLEAYEAYGSYDTMAELTRNLVVNAARAIGKTVVPGRDGSQIDLEGEWKHATIHELVSEATGTTVDNDTSADDLKALAAKHEVALQPHWVAGDIVLELYEKLVEHTLIQPTFVRDYPEAVRPLAKKHRTKPGLVEAWDLIINGVELAPGLLRAQRPGHPARAARGAVAARRRRRSRGDGRRRGLPARARVRHAPGRRHGPRRRPARHAAAGHRHPRGDPLPAVAGRMSRVLPTANSGTPGHPVKVGLHIWTSVRADFHTRLN